MNEHDSIAGTIGELANSGIGRCSSPRFTCFFTHGTPMKGVVSAEEWAKNPDTGIKELLRKHKKEISPFGVEF